MKGISNTFLQKEALPSLDDWSPDMITPYSGSDRKEGLISPDGTRYLVKYAEAHTRLNDLDTSYVNNVLSEYMSSHILGIAGFEVHHTFIGTRGGSLLVACENLTQTRRTGWKMELIIRKMILNRNITKCMLQRKGILLHYNEQGLSENIPEQPLRSPFFTFRSTSYIFSRCRRGRDHFCRSSAGSSCMYLPHPSNAPVLFSFRAATHKPGTEIPAFPP